VVWGVSGGGSPRGTCSASAAMDRNIQWDMSVVLRHFEPRFVSDAALHCQMHNALSQIRAKETQVAAKHQFKPFLRVIISNYLVFNER
jgi:hypothetical protein